MDKLYVKKESKILYILLGSAILLVFILGWIFVKRVYWILLPALFFIGYRLSQLLKHGDTPVLKLEKSGMHVYTPLRTIFIPFSELRTFEVNSKKNRAYYQKQGSTKKLPLFLQGLNLEEVKEIEEWVNNAIH
jgi:hypothetical protein